MGGDWEEKKGIPVYETAVREDDDALGAKIDGASLTTARAPRRRRRRIAIALALALVAFFAISALQIPCASMAKWELQQDTFTAGQNETYDAAKKRKHKKKHHFDGTKVLDLDPAYLPGGPSDPEGHRRLIFVGDIHGSAHELHALLRATAFDPTNDHLISVGDTVTKGPHNTQVLDTLIALNATSARGNHEDSLLDIDASADTELAATGTDIEDYGFKKDRKLLRRLSKKHVRYMRAMPLILRVPALPLAEPPRAGKGSPFAEELLVVHAGLVPAVELERQDPYFVLNMRSMTRGGHRPSVEAEAEVEEGGVEGVEGVEGDVEAAKKKKKKGKRRPWHVFWGWYQDRVFRGKSVKDFDAQAEGDHEVPGVETDDAAVETAKKAAAKQPQVVVYGHHSKAGLKLSRWSNGLDSGCVKGGELTGLVVDAFGGHEIVQVGCKDYKP